MSRSLLALAFCSALVSAPASAGPAAVPSVNGDATDARRRPSATYVLTREDLRRSGATSVADALRMVPGMHVTQLGSSVWGISARGFASQYASKLVVLIDGRNVWSPGVSGVHWDTVDVPLEDVERIEVTRGPAAVEHGANAMNGVVNIITRPASDTHGTLVRAGVGTERLASGYWRHGAELEDGGDWRAWVKGSLTDSVDQTGAAAFVDDDWWLGGAGFRVDRDIAERESLSLRGEAYYGETNTQSVLAGPFVDMPSVTEQENQLSGSNLVAEWSYDLLSGSNLWVRALYDGTDRDSEIFDEGRDTFDLEFRHRFEWREAHRLEWGAGFRLTSSLFENKTGLLYDPGERTDNLFSVFGRDRIALDDDLELTLGARLEHNDYSAFELQPAASLAWTIDAARSAWMSLARVVRTPGQLDEDLVVEQSFETIATQPTHVLLTGNDNFEPEKLWAFDVGYREQVTDRVAIDLAAFWYDYDDLRTREVASFGPDPSNPGDFLQVLLFDNQAEATSLGVELDAEWTVRADWRLRAGYAFLDLDFETQPGSTDTSTAASVNAAAEHQVHVRSRWDVDEDLELDTALYWVDDLGSLVSSYLRLDARVGWRPREDLELSLGVQGLFHDGEVEAQDGFLAGVGEYEAGAFLRLVWEPRTESGPDLLAAVR